MPSLLSEASRVNGPFPEKRNENIPFASVVVVLPGEPSLESLTSMPETGAPLSSSTRPDKTSPESVGWMLYVTSSIDVNQNGSTMPPAMTLYHRSACPPQPQFRWQNSTPPELNP